MDDFDVLARLGSGSFGTVFRARRKADDCIYVIKIVRIAELTGKEKNEAINEVRLLSQLDSPYIVRYYDSFIDHESLHIVMEHCNRGDLSILLRKAKDKNVQSLKEELTWNICLQIMLGLYCLHQQNILHRDLKTANVFLQKDPSQRFFAVKIGDLGVAKLLETSTAFAQTIVGTPYYLSPELCADQPYRDRSDCWALGVLLYECCTLSRPFTAGNQCALIMKIIQAQVEPPPSSHATPQLSQLILWLLQKDWKERPSVKEILCDEFIRSKLDEHFLPLPEELLDVTPTSWLSACSAYDPYGDFHDDHNDGQACEKNTDGSDEKSAIPAENASSWGHGKVEPEPGQWLPPPPPQRPQTNPKPQRTPTAKVGLVSSTMNGLQVRGDRIRGPLSTKRMLSSKVLTRHQVKQTPTHAAIVASSDSLSPKLAEMAIVGSPVNIRTSSSRGTENIAESKNHDKTQGDVLSPRPAVNFTPRNQEKDSSEKKDSKDSSPLSHDEQFRAASPDHQYDDQYDEDFEEYEESGVNVDVDGTGDGDDDESLSAVRMSVDDSVLYQAAGKDDESASASTPRHGAVPRILITPLWAIRDQPLLSLSARSHSAIDNGTSRDTASADAFLLLHTAEEKREKLDARADTTAGVEETGDDEDYMDRLKEEERVKTLQNWIDEIRSSLFDAIGDNLFHKIYFIVRESMETNRTFITDLGETDSYLKDIHARLNESLQTSFEGANRVVLQLKTLLALEEEVSDVIEDYIRS